MLVTIVGDVLVDVVVPAAGVKPGETHHRHISVACGGTANTAIQLARLGEEVKFIGRAGNDPCGLYFIDTLKRNGVSTLISLDSEYPTGLCVSLVQADGERSMVASRGANDHWDKKEIKTYLDQIMKSRAVYFSGYSLLYNSELILHLMEKCHRKIEVWFNPGAPNLIKDYFQKVIQDFVDILILNLDEARAITGRDEMDEISTGLGKLVDLSVITLGEAGCVVVKGKEFVKIPAENVLESIDTTGAGDVFSAGFMAGRLRGLDELQCAELGHKAAADFLSVKRRTA